MLCLTVSLPWPIMLLHSADPVSSTCCLAKGDQAVTDAGCNKDSGACFCQQSTGQLQQPTGWCQQLIATTAPSHPEHCRSSCCRSQEIRAYDVHPTWSSLAAGSTANHVQDSSSGLQVSARHGSTIPSDILWADVNSCQPASSICTLWSTDCSTHQNKLRRPQFRHPRTSRMERSSCCTASTRHYTDNVQEQTKDILVQRVTVHTAHLQLSGDFVLYKCS